MRDLFLSFEWRVAPGYEWQEWLDKRGRPLEASRKQLSALESSKAIGRTNAERGWWETERDAADLAKRTGPVLNRVDVGNSRPYKPLEDSALFKTFAEVDYRDRAAISEFARKHGDLGLPPEHQAVALRDKSGRVSGVHSAHGESHFAWALEICRMREAVGLSEQGHSVERLRRLKWLCDRHLHHVAGRLSFSDGGEPRLAIAPINLISAMWLQLALALTGGKRFVACKFCRRVFEISTDQTGFRSDREFCSMACKTKDYRHRKRSAIQLAQTGAALESIAKRIATNRRTVKKWLADALKLKNRTK
jgi:hypothetical protein